MKRSICYIVFFCFFLWGGEQLVDCCFPWEEEVEEMQRQTEEATAHQEATFSVLLAANDYAEISVRPATSACSLLARRYRPAGFSLDKWFAYFTGGQLNQVTHLCKTSVFASQRHTAQQKYSGYYVYALRKIIV